ncbi:MAG: aminotransferase class III-fold pyridoxal phosphate-dependent enzyme, partial [Chloroflexi bacterium]|nr:aminotransferase class III-fold pyridoxal phosphate-dependent enzyme [Chloroflexota bacterium]
VPLGVMFARESIMTWPKGSHGNTYGGNPIACAAALATIELIENGYMQNAVEMGEYTLNCLKQIMNNHPSIGEVRGKGLMIGVDFVKDRQTRKPDEKLRDRIVDEAFRYGLLLLGCGKSTIRISPPLNVTRSQIDEALEIFEEAIRLSE